MKIKTIKLKSEFTPINVHVTIESLEELLNLYVRLNVSSYAIKNDSWVTPTMLNAVERDENKLLFSLLEHLPRKYGGYADDLIK